jgi:hypothetical protein
MFVLRSGPEEQINKGKDAEDPRIAQPTSMKNIILGKEGVCKRALPILVLGRGNLRLPEEHVLGGHVACPLSLPNSVMLSPSSTSGFCPQSSAKCCV